MDTPYQTMDSIEQEKNAYYGKIASKLDVEKDSPERLVCKTCQEIFYFITTKEQLLEAIEEKIKGKTSFDTEIVRFYECSYFAGRDTISDWGSRCVCAFCQQLERRISRQGFLQRLRNAFKGR